MNITRTSKAIPKASHRTYAAKEYKGKPFTVLPVDSHYMKNVSRDKFTDSKYIHQIKLWRSRNPSTSKYKYYFYDSQGHIRYESNDKNDWRSYKIKAQRN